MLCKLTVNGQPEEFSFAPVIHYDKSKWTAFPLCLTLMCYFLVMVRLYTSYASYLVRQFCHTIIHLITRCCRRGNDCICEFASWCDFARYWNRNPRWPAHAVLSRHHTPAYTMPGDSHQQWGRHWNVCCVFGSFCHHDGIMCYGAVHLLHTGLVTPCIDHKPM